MNLKHEKTMKYLFTLTLTMLLCMTAMANDNGEEQRFDPEEYRAQMDAYITKKAELTTEEAQKFFPIFHEMRQKQMEKNKQIRKLKREKLAETSTDEEFTSVILQIEALKVDIAEIGKTYSKKLCKAIPARKVYAAMLAEDCFHRDMLRKSRKDKAA